MQNTPTQNTLISRFDFNDEMGYSLTKLSFLADAIRHWNCKEIDLSEDQLFGFGLLCEDVIEDIKKLTENLEQ